VVAVAALTLGSLGDERAFEALRERADEGTASDDRAQFAFGTLPE
jgi:hypothetical protein